MLIARQFETNASISLAFVTYDGLERVHDAFHRTTMSPT